jgi:NTE family protein
VTGGKPDRPAPRPSAPPRLALVIGAGGIKCAAALGVQRALERAGLTPDLVVGCSAGSLYAALIALGHDAEAGLETTTRLWTRDLTSKRDRVALLKALFPRWLGFDERFGLIDDRRIRARVQEAFGDRTFADARIPLRIVATDFRTGEKVVLSEGPLTDAIRGSLAIPFVFRPWSAGGRLLTDGFLSDPLPVDVAIRENARVIVALGFEAPLQRQVSSPLRFAFQVTTVMSNNLLRANFAFHNLAHHGEVISVLPQFPGDLRAFDTSRLREIVDLGESAMERDLHHVRRAVDPAVA